MSSHVSANPHGQAPSSNPVVASAATPLGSYDSPGQLYAPAPYRSSGRDTDFQGNPVAGEDVQLRYHDKLQLTWDHVYGKGGSSGIRGPGYHLMAMQGADRISRTYPSPFPSYLEADRRSANDWHLSRNLDIPGGTIIPPGTGPMTSTIGLPQHGFHTAAAAAAWMTKHPNAALKTPLSTSVARNGVHYVYNVQGVPGLGYLSSKVRKDGSYLEADKGLHKNTWQIYKSYFGASVPAVARHDPMSNGPIATVHGNDKAAAAYLRAHATPRKAPAHKLAPTKAPKHQPIPLHY
jgi:hypothetical protein